MPLLEGKALQLYERHFTLPRYNEYNECRQSPLLAPTDIPKPWTCLHQPRHDAESYFWMIFFFILQAIPAEDSDKPDRNLATFRNAMYDLQVGAATHMVGGRMRSAFFTDEEKYRLCLHPGLVLFAPLIAELGEQVRIEWEFLSKQPPSDHVHEACLTRQLKNPLPDDSQHFEVKHIRSRSYQFEAVREQEAKTGGVMCLWCERLYIRFLPFLYCLGEMGALRQRCFHLA